MVLFDPLDREILERALDAACATVKEFGTSIEFESDEDLEAALWRELIEIALQNGISDPETLAQLVSARPQRLMPSDATSSAAVEAGDRRAGQRRRRFTFP